MPSPVALHVTQWGARGDPAVLVHGSFGWGEFTWRLQRPLADEFQLLLVDRRGFGASPGPDAGDFEVDAEGIAELLPDGAHLVGHSYGGVAALLAAAARSERVRSLTVCEPPALGLARGDEAVEAFIARTTEARESAIDAADYAERFFAAFGLPVPALPTDAAGRRAATSSWRQRDPSEATIELDVLREAPFPMLVVRGAWDSAPPEAQARGRPALHAVCDVLVEELRAQSVTIPGVAHSVPRAGETFNDCLRSFWETT